MDIEALIPHRDRMKLIDRIVEITDEGATTTARVSDRWPLYEGGSVESIALIEIVAQTAAVHISGRREDGRNAGDRRGWMVGIKNADFFLDRIPVDTLLEATVKSMYRIDHYNVLEGRVYAGSDLICRVEVQVLRESESEPLQEEEFAS